jgi:hypothetical protein
MPKWKLTLIEAIGIGVLWLIGTFIENTYGKPTAVHIVTPPVLIYYIIKGVILYKRGRDLM